MGFGLRGQRVVRLVSRRDGGLQCLAGQGGRRVEVAGKEGQRRGVHRREVAAGLLVDLLILVRRLQRELPAVFTVGGEGRILLDPRRERPRVFVAGGTEAVLVEPASGFRGRARTRE